MVLSLGDMLRGELDEKGRNRVARLTGKVCLITGAASEIGAGIARAAVAVLLASDEATYITGSEFDIDGGFLAGSAASPKRV